MKGDITTNKMIKDISSGCADFPNLKEKVEKLRDTINKYNFVDLVKAIFCINICTLNRSALENSLALNQCLIRFNDFGNKSIKSYEEFFDFFTEIKQFLKIGPFDDYTMEDFGEVKLRYDNEVYSAILGNGYENVYGILQFMEQAAQESEMESLLKTVLAYSSQQIDYFYDINKFDEDFEVKFVPPSEQLFQRVNDYFNEVYDKGALTEVASEFKHLNLDISKTHFIEKNGGIWPLYNTSILVDFYSLMTINISKKASSDVVDYTIAKKLSNLSMLDDENKPSILYPVSLVNDTKFISENYYSFLLCGRSGMIIGINGSKFNDSSELDKEIRLIYDLHKKNELKLAEVISKRSHGYKGIHVTNNLGLGIIVYDELNDMYQPSFILKDGKEKYHSCTSADIVYFLTFMIDVDEIFRFLKYESEEKQGQLLAFGGVSTNYFLWKESEEVIEKGAIQYSLMSVQHGFTDSYVRDYFVNNLSMYPFEIKSELFEDFSRWNIRALDREGYYEYSDKITRSFGGNGRLFSNKAFVFFAHNIDMYSNQEYSDKLMNLITLIDDLNIRNSTLYSQFYEKNEFFNGKLIYFLHLPIEYARSHDNTGYTYDSERKYVYSDALVDESRITIRYAVDKERLFEDLEVAKDRTVEATFFVELNTPLRSFIEDDYLEMVEKINQDIHLPKGIATFSSTISYNYCDRHPGYRVSDKAYHEVRKLIAIIGNDKNIMSGSYEGKDATKVVREMQGELIAYFEKEISKYDRLSLHLELLEIYSTVTHEVNIHRIRYGSFENIEVSEGEYVKQRTLKLREKARYNQRLLQYILETNLNIICDRGNQKAKTSEIEYLLAFSNWLVVLQDAADICYKSKVEKAIEINHDFTVDIVDSEEMIDKIAGLSKRVYENKDYSVKMDEIDKAFFNDFTNNFRQDFGFDFQLFMTILELLQLGYETTFAISVGINVYKFRFEDFIQEFRRAYEVEFTDEEIKRVIDYLVCDVVGLKFWRGELRTFLPINERVNRDVRYDVRPIVIFNEDYYFSPVTIYELMNRWMSGVLDFYPPYECGMKNIMIVLTRWKKRYEDHIVKDVVELFRENDIQLIWPEAKIHRLDKMGNHPEELGDYDIIAYDEKRKQLWIIECKMLSKVGSNHEAYMQQFNFFLDKKYDEKFQKRIDYLAKHYKRFLSSQGIEVDCDLNLIPYMVTNKVLFSRYKEIDFDIITIHEFEKIFEINDV